MQRRTLVFTALCAFLLMAADEPRWVVLNRAVGEAIRAKDFRALRTSLRELKPLLPGNARVTYNLAAANSVLRETQEALQGLRNLAHAGLIYDVAADPDFAALKPLPGLPEIRSLFETNRNPISHSEHVSPIAEPDLIPEDMAWDPVARRFFVSSVRRTKIITSDGGDFARTDLPVFALAMDPRHRILWATTGWAAPCEKCSASDKDTTALLALNRATGAVIRRIESPVKGLLGDITVSRSGDVYVSETTYGALLHVKPGGNVLERLDTPGEFRSPQTPALSRDEKTLFVPDYVRGIAAVNLTTGHTRWLQPADGIITSGIDGLYLRGDSFIAIQNGTNPARILRLSLDLSRQEILEANTPTLGEPTHGTVIGDQFFYLANTGWGDYDAKGQKQPGRGPVRSTIRKLRLKTM